MFSCTFNIGCWRHFMDFTVESISSTKKKVDISLCAEEVNAAIDKVVSQYKQGYSLPGFRKGKVPNRIIEQKFGKEILDKATEETIKTHVTEVLTKEALKPLCNLQADDTHFLRNEPFTCSLTFEVLPEIVFPEYEGLVVNQEAVGVADSETSELIQNIQTTMAELIDVTEDRLPQDGDTVDVDYCGTEDGKPVDGVSGEHFVVTLGQKQALDDFESLVKTTKVGEEKSGIVNFPNDYGHPNLAGKSILFQIKLNSIKHPVLPALDIEFAKKTGYEDMEKLQEAARQHLTNHKKQNAKSDAMKQLIKTLLEQVEFDIPEGMLESRIERILGDRNVRLKNVEGTEDSGETQDKVVYNQAKAEALELLRPQIFLMALAEKEGLVVMEQEVERALYNMAIRAKQDYKKFREAYYRSGLVYELRDHLLAEKAMELIYSKANITEVPLSSLK